MNVRVNTQKGAAVDQDAHWKPIATCPRGVNVWLLTIHNVAIKGIYTPGDTFIKGWFPMPNIPKEMK